MCEFLSVVTDTKGKLYWLNEEQRKQLETTNEMQYRRQRMDSHSFICEYYKLQEDKCNKYEIDIFEKTIEIDTENIKSHYNKVVKNVDKILGSFTNINLEAVKQNGWNLEKIKDPSEEMCLIALRSVGNVLQYIKNPTREMCLIAVTKSGSTLQLVKKQDKEICLAAVTNYGEALEYVKKQTQKIIVAAIEQDADALNYINEKFINERFLKLLIRMNSNVILKLDDIENYRDYDKRKKIYEDRNIDLEKLILYGLKQDPQIFYDIELDLVRYKTAVKADYTMLEGMRRDILDEDFLISIVKKHPEALKYIYYKTRKICLAAVRKDGTMLKYVNEQNKDKEICKIAVRNNMNAIDFIPYCYKKWDEKYNSYILED